MHSRPARHKTLPQKQKCIWERRIWQKKLQKEKIHAKIPATGRTAAAMEQVPEELVKEQFDRVLKTVQETAREQVSRYQGQICDVLVEEINENDSSLVTGRMSNNTLVHFPGDASLVGKLVNVSLDECHGFYYMGHMV